jgi:hypothetical protein
MSIPAFVRKAYPEPLSLRDGIEILYDSDEVTDASKPALKSAALDAVRYALRSGDQLPTREEALAADVRPLLAVLPAAARVAAVAKNHRSPGDHEGRARRFVEVLTGGRSVDRSKLRFPCPDSWQPLVDAIPDRNNANGEMAFLHRCCVVAGVSDAPSTMPSYEQIVEAARHINGEKAVNRATKASMSQYRTARKRLLSSAKNGEQREALKRCFGPLPTAHSARTSHLGVEAATVELLEASGLVAAGMTPDDMFRALAPGLADDFDYWMETPGNQRSDAFQAQCHGTLLRVAGWVIRAGYGSRLRQMTLLDFYLIEIQTDDPVALNPRIARQVNESDEDAATISLLELAAEGEAEASLRRSTVTEAGTVGVDVNGRPWFTEAIHANCSRLWAMTAGVYRDLGARGGEPAKRWALVAARWGRFQKQLTDRKIPAEHRILAKDKLKMVQTVTLPQLVCIGMPLRRREVRALREEWMETVRRATEARHADPHSHPEVVEVETRYFDAALPFTILSLAVDDGLRRKQYTRGRLGNNANFRIALERDGANQAVGIARLTTHWSGEKRDPAHLKIRDKKKLVTRRDGRIVRRGFVDHIVLWDLIRHWRPRQLVANGSLSDLAAYDLETDLRKGQFALFPSAKDVARPEKSRTDIGDLFGKELHYIVGTWLRPDLPAWDDLGPEWRSLWAIHITRLLIGSHWGGARENWKAASYLTMDTESTLRDEYSEIDEGLQDRLGPEESNWEHLRAYNHWLDRLYFNFEEFDPTEDPDLPLPPHLREQIQSAPTLPAKKRRIRRARPGQTAPRARSR